MGAKFNFPPVNGLYHFQIHGQIYHLVAPLCPNEANKPGYGQLYIFNSAEAGTKRLENQLDQGCMSEWLHRLAGMLQQVNPLYSVI
jgi:hypothetical protein